MNDVNQNPKKRTTTQDRIAWPFLVIMVALMIMAPVWTITTNPYADYAMPMVGILLVVTSVIILLYNKIRLGVWLPGRKKDLK
jgi:lipopolysaccharide export LptBFGC system permease protein LptF